MTNEKNRVDISTESKLPVTAENRTTNCPSPPREQREKNKSQETGITRGDGGA